VRGLLLETLLAHLAAKATPLTLSDATLLVELIKEAAKAVSAKGVVCRYGGEGAHKGANVCIPARWSDEDRASRRATCGHCPVFRRQSGA